ncbi:MAG: hypothetical protein ACJ76Y_19735 [Thermoanaerobaculia bacterium]
MYGSDRRGSIIKTIKNFFLKGRRVIMHPAAVRFGKGVATACGVAAVGVLKAVGIGAALTALATPAALAVGGIGAVTATTYVVKRLRDKKQK